MKKVSELIFKGTVEFHFFSRKERSLANWRLNPGLCESGLKTSAPEVGWRLPNQASQVRLSRWFPYTSQSENPRARQWDPRPHTDAMKSVPSTAPYTLGGLHSSYVPGGSRKVLGNIRWPTLQDLLFYNSCFEWGFIYIFARLFHFIKRFFLIPSIFLPIKA